MNKAGDHWIAIMGKNELVRRALGGHVFHVFIQSKQIDWNQYRSQITEYELERYLPIL
jgi:glutamine synthetase